MTINAWKTSFIGLNKPSKVLSGTADSFTPVSLWPYSNGSDDPYWSGGQNPQYYRWQVSFTVNEKLHGSHLTRTPFKFDAQDIEVGDFVAGAQDGKVCQIMSILEKNNFEVVAIVEDRLRYNTFRDPTGFGLFTTPGPVVFFQINELGFPMLDPIPGEAAADFFSNVMSRFQYLNPLTNYLLEKPNNGFQTGDAVCIENGEFTLSDANNVTKFIGTVVFPGPGPDQFILRPGNGIIDFVPGLPGSVGDYIYPSIDGSGDLTTDDASRRPIFMKIADAIPCVTTGTGIDPAGVDGDIVEINRTFITITSGTGTYNVDAAVAAINTESATHKVTASKVGAATEVFSDPARLSSAYGLVAGYTPFSIEINGVPVVFTTTTSGSAAYGDPVVADANDMIADINAAHIEDIVAYINNFNEIKIRHNAGGAINIVNILNDGNGNPFAGANSISSLATSTPANTTTYTLRLTRADGGPMTIRDFQGNFLTDCGVISGQNGRYALGLYIEQGLRSSATTVVANLAAKDALHPLVGDQVYVINDENNEWAMFLYDGTTWNRFSNYRSDATDAKTLSMTFDLTSASSGTFSMGNISQGRKVIDVSVEVINGSSSDNTISVGVDGDLSLLMSDRDSNLAKDGQYSVTTNYLTENYTEILVALNVANPSGTAIVRLTYV
jgi:hypothetical protein